MSVEKLIEHHAAYAGNKHALDWKHCSCPEAGMIRLQTGYGQAPVEPADTRERLLWDMVEELPSVERYLGYTRGRVPQAMANSLRAFLKRAEALGILKEERP